MRMPLNLSTSTRALTAAGLVLVAGALHYVGALGWTLPLWLLLGIALGVLVGRWWVVALALFPWPLGVGVGLLTDRYRYLGEAWQLAWLLSLTVGALGIALGLGLRALLARDTNRG